MVGPRARNTRLNLVIKVITSSDGFTATATLARDAFRHPVYEKLRLVLANASFLYDFLICPLSAPKMHGWVDGCPI